MTKTYTYNSNNTPYQRGFNDGYNGRKNLTKGYKFAFGKEERNSYADGYERGMRDRASVDGTQ